MVASLLEVPGPDFGFLAAGSSKKKQIILSVLNSPIPPSNFISNWSVTQNGHEFAGIGIDHTRLIQLGNSEIFSN